jgi:hypothetical protein
MLFCSASHRPIAIRFHLHIQACAGLALYIIRRACPADFFNGLLGQSLNDYCNGRLYWGIKTGLNRAFVIDRVTRDRLTAEHQSSVEVLKPFLRGRDVKRWRPEYKDLWLVYVP